ncbi:ABC transporter permease [Yimella sp. cx-51]|uniref:ABC transporter permease n=1 Tax=Yimella sp. cx-51 TaxID=2770551 RepID=UPI00165DE95A|nr:ABC transporter permease [Yimella sp. cx-51]MBC9956015.1 ABC transporter permease [Yimella sp. cx-51]QTH37448.1 ABC transporter permease [Yimella sp. cx-51]
MVLNANDKKQRIDDLAATAGGNVDVGGIDDAEGVSLIRSAWERLRRNPRFLLGSTIVLLIILMAIFAPLLAPNDPTVEMLKDQTSTNNPIPPAQDGYPLGGDSSGRDLLSRLIYGARQTLLIAFGATGIAFFAGLVLGTLAGAFGGWVDSLIMRVVDVMLSLPSLLLAFSITALFARGSVWTVIVAIGIAMTPTFARLLRGSMMAQRSSDHVLAAQSLGVKRHNVIFRHMLPNSLSPVLVQATMVFATSIVDAAALSFLGVGNPDDRDAEWGQMLGQAQNFVDTYPSQAILPALLIIAAALGFTLMGESLREALDPKSRR